MFTPPGSTFLLRLAIRLRICSFPASSPFEEDALSLAAGEDDGPGEAGVSSDLISGKGVSFLAGAAAGPAPLLILSTSI